MDFGMYHAAASSWLILNRQQGQKDAKLRWHKAIKQPSSDFGESILPVACDGDVYILC